MTTNDAKQPSTGGSGPGYRGALPPREDRLGRPWLLIVVGIFVAIIVLSILGVPSRLIPDPTPIPLPTNPPITESASPSASPSPSPSVEGSPTLEESPTPSPTSS